MHGAYGDQVRANVSRWGIGDRVHCLGIVDEEQKLDLYARALAVYNGVYDEDYGYLTLEAFHASKPVITHSDSGGPLEFVIDGRNGYITEPDPAEIAATLDRLYADRKRAEELGHNGRRSLSEHDVTWDHVVRRLVE
jgi:glycosyltransferase involved in cell wall biosynthesis